MDGAISQFYQSVKGKYDLAKNVDEIFQKFQQHAKYLFAKEEDICRLVASRQVSMRKTCECSTWLDDVKKVKLDFEDIKARYETAHNGGMGLTSLPGNAKLSEEMARKTEEIIILKDRMKLKPGRILFEDDSVNVVEKKSVKEIIHIQSFHGVVEKLLGWLQDSSIKSVGVWGMAGVGKTTILEILNNEVEKLGMFDIVIWITVSKEWSIGKIQQDIVKRMKLYVEGRNSDLHMADLIRKALENKRYLVLLDEVFSNIDLRGIGILDAHENGKLVLATRYRSVCDMMDLDEDIKVEKMSRVDAWNLFQKIVGQAVEHPIIKPIAERIVKECGELPHLIKAVARVLRNKFSEDDWLRILSNLQPPKHHQLRWPMEEVLDIFKTVYDGLEDNLKMCLLFGASFSEDHEICQDYLIECWKAEELIQDASTFAKARREGQILLEKLIDRYLLDMSKDMKHVKMPIIFRNMALRFANDDHNLFLLVKTCGKAPGYPPVEQWRRARVISLMKCDLQCLPAKPESCMTSTLFLQHNGMLTEIPPSFFDLLTSLRVLDLSGTGIRSLPESIPNLNNLRGLYLNYCRKLVVLPKHMGKLKKLEVLEICFAGLMCLPSSIGELTSLQCLKVSFMSSTSPEDGIETLDMDIIPSNMVKKLSLLQELTIDVDPFDVRWIGVAAVIAKEVASLAMLNSLSFYFPTVNCFEIFISSSISWKTRQQFPLPDDKFKSFRFVVGSHHDLNHVSKLDNSTRCFAKRHLKYFDGNGTTSHIIKEVLQWVCMLEIIGHQSLINLLDFGVDNMECLEICIIEGCHKFESLASISACSPMAVIFPWLKELHLFKLHQLHCIWEGISISPRSFSNLTTLQLCDCPNLKKLISVGMITHLQGLQYLRIEKCPQIVEIISSDHHSGQTLSSLKTIELIDLASLVSICSSDLIDWPCLQRVKVIACEDLVALPFNARNVKQLQSIRCSETWWEALMLQPEVKAMLQQTCCFV